MIVWVRNAGRAPKSCPLDYCGTCWGGQGWKIHSLDEGLITHRCGVSLLCGFLASPCGILAFRHCSTWFGFLVGRWCLCSHTPSMVALLPGSQCSRSSPRKHMVSDVPCHFCSFLLGTCFWRIGIRFCLPIEGVTKNLQSLFICHTNNADFNHDNIENYRDDMHEDAFNLY